MAAAKDAVLCPECGARNKAKWEFCVKCGESLQDAPAADEALAPSSRAEKPPAEGAGSPWNAVAIVVALLVIGGAAVAAYRTLGKGVEPTRPQTGILTVATLPPSVAPVPAAPSQAGHEPFAEGQRLLAAGDAAAALPLLAQAVNEDPENALYVYMYATALWKTGDRNEALTRAAEAARLDPARRPDYAAYLNLAGRSREAAQEYETIVAANPRDYDALAMLGQLWTNAGDPARAAAVLKEAAQYRPGDPKLAASLGTALEKTGDLAGAAQAYGGALSVNPQDGGLRGRLAEVLFKQGDVDRAVGVYQTGIRDNPAAPELLRGLGGVQERAGRIAEAIAAYREYARLAPNASDAQDFEVRATQLEKRQAAKKP
jgi:Flp pilus assembly protein TadD